MEAAKPAATMEAAKPAPATADIVNVVSSLEKVIDDLNDINERQNMGHVHTIKRMLNNLRYLHKL